MEIFLGKTSSTTSSRFVRTSPARPGLPTFIELAEDWLSTEGARLVRPEDARKHVEHLKQIWKFNELELKPAIIKNALFALLKPAGALSPTTVNKILGAGRRIVREAQFNERWGGKNPFDLVRRLKQSKPVTRALTLAEARAMLPHLREDRRREALTLLYLGLPRPGEMKRAPAGGH